jgi:hypothetical protein
MAQKITMKEAREHQRIDFTSCWGSNFDGRDRSDKRLPVRYEWIRRKITFQKHFNFDLTPNIG